jgi:hypothetical protein
MSTRVKPVGSYRVTVVLTSNRRRDIERPQDAGARTVVRWLERAVKRSGLKPIAWPYVEVDDSHADYFIRNQMAWRASVVADIDRTVAKMVANRDAPSVG